MDIEITEESGFDDTQDVITDVKELSQQYIGPIDMLKSIYQPAQTSSISKNIAEVFDININHPPESRAHCFYRMVGFPVLAPDGSFYSPGYEPNSNKTIEQRTKVNTAYLANSQLTKIVHLRESAPRKRKNIFNSQDINSTIYGLALRYPKTFAGYFDQSSMGIDPLKADLQSFSIKDRVNDAAYVLNGSGIVNYFEKQNHILRPFIVDPLILETVNPIESRICVPFLNTKEDTKINIQGAPLKRPIIEFICRLRLQQTNQTDTYFINRALSLINGKTSVADTSVQNIKDTILALSGKNNLSELKNNTLFLNNINNFSDIQANTLNMLIKTIKSLVFQLANSINNLDLISGKIAFKPIPDKEGPEFGGTIRNSIDSEYDQKIANLTILDLNKQRQQQIISDRLGGGNELFASAVLASSQKSYSDDINKLKRQKSDLGNEALDSLANIERICGEVSGLGLIDVLAIYTALWAIDIDALIGLLDDNAFNRLYDFNAELRTKEVEARKKNGKSSINCIDALKTFETNLYNILLFADKIFNAVATSPSGNTSGYIY